MDMSAAGMQDAAAAAAAADPTSAGGASNLGAYRLVLKTVQAVAFKVLVEALKELLTDVMIEFDATGMKILAMDTSHVVLVHLKLEASKFEVFHCDGKISVGLNMLNLHKLIKTINNNNTLSLYIDKDDVNHLGIKIENTDKNSKTSYKLNLLDLDHSDIYVDPTAFTEVVTLPSADFQKICRDMHALADLMEIRSIHNQLIFSCKGDFCSQETVISDAAGSAAAATPFTGAGGAAAAAGTAMAGGTAEIVQGVFSIKHLVLFTKCTNLCSTLELYLKNDYPLIIRYDVSSLGSIRLALAPHGG
jgi:proliferating cell nuclear antigen